MGEAALEPEQEGVSKLPLSKVQPNVNQPRKNFEPESLDDLTDSIRKHGLIQPICVRLLSSGYYQIISGERRWRAAKNAGLEEIPVVIIEADDRKVMELSLIENLQREDLNAMEEAQGYLTLMQEFGMTQEAVSKEVGKSRSAVANAVRLLSLPEDLRELVEQDKLTAGHARAVLSVTDDQARHALAEKIMSDGLSVRQAEELAKKLSGRPEEEPKKVQRNPLDVDYAALAAKELGDHLGRKVKILSGKRKGRVELEYYGMDDLNDLLDALKTLSGRNSG
jgi:ParB family chromosome partitioning protein